MTTNKRLDAIRQRWEIPAGSAFDMGLAMEDIAYLLSLVEKKDKVLEKLSTMPKKAGRIDEYRSWAEQALKCDEGGEGE